MRERTVCLAALISLPALAVATPAFAGELLGIAMDDRIEVDGTELVLNGLGLREATFLKVDVYVAGLYLTQESSDADAILAANEPKRIALHFVRKVKKSKIAEAWDEGFAKTDPGGIHKQALSRLNGMMVDFDEGDRMSFTHRPGTGVEVSVNGSSKGVLEGDAVARALWAIWLGPEPPNEGLKTGMLGLGGS